VAALRPADFGDALVRIRPAATGAWTLWLLTIAGIGVGLSLGTWAGELAEIISLLIAFVAFATVGAVIASRRPRNPIGWLFLGIGVLTAIGALGEAYSDRAFREPGPPSTLAVWAAWTQGWFWYPLFAMCTLFTLLLFPSGLPSRRWRPVLWVSVASLAVVTLMAAMDSTIQAAGRKVPNPIGITALEDVEATGLFLVFTSLFALGVVAATISIIVRFRRSRGEEREQLKWFAYAAALLAVTLIASLVLPAFERSLAGQLALSVAILGIPVSCGIAITRYRLYDIDRIINRTLVYAVLSVLLVGIYVGAVFGLSAVVRSITGQPNNALVIAASTLAVAALFGPARRRIQGFIDRRFYRRKYDATQTLEAFSTRLREEVDLDALTGDLVRVVQTTMQPTHVSVWLRLPSAEPSGPGEGVR
jgi:hypothetical protein